MYYKSAVEYNQKKIDSKLFHQYYSDHNRGLLFHAWKYVYKKYFESKVNHIFSLAIHKGIAYMMNKYFSFFSFSMKQIIAKALVASVAAVMWFVWLASAAGTFTDTQQPSNLNVAWWNTLGSTPGSGDAPLIVTIRNAVNLVLGFLGLIALIILLYGGFQMVTAAGDDGKYKKGFTILRQAGIGLIFIGLAALFVNLIFWVIGSIV